MYENRIKEIPGLLKRLRRSKKEPSVEIKTKEAPAPVLFGGDPVVESYKLEELLAARARGERICDFLRDQTELPKWKAWFRFKYTFRGYTKKTNPYAITQGKRLRLWKIWEGA